MAMKNFDPSAEVRAHEIPLWLPSQINGSVPVTKELHEIEFDLRVAQAHEALDDLRAQLQVRAHVYKFKERFLRGQTANTRARNSLNTIQAKVDAAAAEYRAAYKALNILGKILGKTTWSTDLRELHPDDVRDISEGRKNDSLGTKHISWIWTVQMINSGDSKTKITDSKRFNPFTVHES